MTEQKRETVINWKDPSGADRYMIFDAVDTVTHRRDLELTESPVDSGTPVADHAFVKPLTLSIKGFVSNTPLPSNPAAGSSHDLMGGGFMQPTNITFNDLPQAPPIAPLYTPGGITSALTTGTESLIDRLKGKGPQNTAAGIWKSVSGFNDRVLWAFGDLEYVQLDVNRCTITTTLATYSGMVLVSMIVPETVQDGDLKEFTLEFREVRTASTRDTESPEPAEVRGSPPRQSSKQTKKATNEDKKDEKAQKSSLLVQLIDSVL